MYKLLISGFALFFFAQCQADELDSTLQYLESEWAKTYFSTEKEYRSKQNKSGQYSRLLKISESLVKNYPKRAEPLIWQANLIATNAEFENGFDALSSIHQARDILLKAIELNPQAMDGAAFVTLGSLYHMAPGWPIAFGSEKRAEEAFNTALKINPNGIDSNYFYGEFLLSRGKNKEAVRYFQKAIEAPVRKEQIFADEQLQKEARMGLQNTEFRKVTGLQNIFISLFSSASNSESYR